MDFKQSWLAASIFFLAGAILNATLGLIRGQLYAASMTKPSWRYPDPLIEKMIPTYLQDLAAVAFILSVAVAVLPFVLKALGILSTGAKGEGLSVRR